MEKTTSQVSLKVRSEQVERGRYEDTGMGMCRPLPGQGRRGTMMKRNHVEA